MSSKEGWCTAVGLRYLGRFVHVGEETPNAACSVTMACPRQSPFEAARKRLSLGLHQVVIGLRSLRGFQLIEFVAAGSGGRTGSERFAVLGELDAV